VAEAGLHWELPAVSSGTSTSTAATTQASSPNASDFFNSLLGDYDTAIRLNPSEATSYYNRAAVHVAKGEYDQAAADFRKALGLRSDYNLARQALDSIKTRLRSSQ